VQRELAVGRDEADRLRRHYWLRYGATLLGLMHHHGVKPAHFLHHTHELPGLEQQLACHPQDRAAIARLRGRKFVLTNAPRAYAERVLRELGMARFFDGVIPVEDMTMFGHWRPKPDVRMLRRVAARLRVAPSRCVLVEDTLVHQKAARRLGMKTVWMQRWLKHHRHGPEVGVYLHRKPVYVCARIRSLQQLQSVP
jgi:putative hydrolase of the HAD superfamily